jgi:hypothetical protein
MEMGRIPPGYQHSSILSWLYLVNRSPGQAGWNPENRTQVMYILATSLSLFGQQTGKNQPLEEAIGFYLEALKAWTREQVPLNWAKTQHNGGAISTLDLFRAAKALQPLDYEAIRQSIKSTQGRWTVDSYVSGHRKRERIGPDKRLAETILRKRKVEIAEGRFLERRKPITTTFDELADAYLKYARENKRSWDRDATSIKKLSEVFGGKRLTEISPAAVERYKAFRMASKTVYGRRPTPATLNRELACLKHMFNVARKGLIESKGGAPTENPVSAVEFLEEHNVRDRVLTPEEFARMLEVSPDYLKPIL